MPERSTAKPRRWPRSSRHRRARVRRHAVPARRSRRRVGVPTSKVDPGLPPAIDRAPTSTIDEFVDHVGLCIAKHLVEGGGVAAVKARRGATFSFTVSRAEMRSSARARTNARVYAVAGTGHGDGDRVPSARSLKYRAW